MGTMVGDDGAANQTGMAPGAEWIACRACSAGGGCPAVELLTCAEWIAAPYPIGTPAAADPDLRPQIVNNSWGDCDRAYDGWFQSVVDAWHAAGIYPVFSNGNASNCAYSQPPGCNTVGNPGRYGNVTSVGSTGQADGAYAPHSNWGPTDALDTVNPAALPTIKPQVVAPGVNIRSATATSDTSYDSWTGTSMSAPHVSGLIALMWQAAPCLVGDYAATETIIQETANPIPYPSACGGEGPGNLPNQATGWGEIDADTAVLAAIAHCDTDWLPWVTESPVSGVVPASSGAGINFNFSCMADGDNHGTVRLLSNDPCQGPVEMDLTLHCGPATAAMTVVKETIPPASMESFAFTGDLSGAMHDGHSLSSSGLLPGTFTVVETPVSGWTVDAITCDDGDSTGDVGAATATFRLGIGEAVTCTFVNRQDLGACGYPVDLVLGDHMVVGTAAWDACHSIFAADGFAVDVTGVVTFRAGSSITLGNGFAVQQGGTFTATIDPTLE